jgi:hypothetical protein
MSGSSWVATMPTARRIRSGAPNKEPKWPIKAFLNDSYVPALTAYECRGYIISAWARPEFTNGFTSVAIVYERGQFGSIIQVQRIEGQLFESKEQAEQHGIELCKEWIDNQEFSGADEGIKRLA